MFDNLPVLHYNQLLGIAQGMNPDELGLDAHEISVEPLLHKQLCEEGGTKMDEEKENRRIHLSLWVPTSRAWSIFFKELAELHEDPAERGTRPGVYVRVCDTRPNDD